MTWRALHIFILLINNKPGLPGILVYCYGGSRAINSRGYKHEAFFPALPGETMHWFWGFQHAERVLFSELWPFLFNNRFLASKNHTKWFRLQEGNDAYAALLKYTAIHSANILAVHVCKNTPAKQINEACSALYRTLFRDRFFDLEHFQPVFIFKIGTQKNGVCI